MSSYNIIGLMSGTSTDGLDIAYCSYTYKDGSNWEFKVLFTDSIPYPPDLRDRIHFIKDSYAWELCQLDHDLSVIWSDMVNHFIIENRIKKEEIDAVASHGQTIFHRPEINITTQIGNGQVLSTRTGIPVICDFRNKDVQHGGQGAPLVPIGDKLLFSKNAEAFLNIGGFSNISIINNQIEAFDIGPGNLPLNYLANKRGENYDPDGQIAASGQFIPSLFAKLNEIRFYHEKGPKSLGIEWLENQFYPLLNKHNVEDELNTVTEHIAFQIAEVLKKKQIHSVYLTGGGTFNHYLIERIKNLCNSEVIVPEEVNITFKEAIIFGFLGALFLEDKSTCLSSVTGADKDVCGGVYYSP